MVPALVDDIAPKEEVPLQGPEMPSFRRFCHFLRQLVQPGFRHMPVFHIVDDAGLLRPDRPRQQLVQGYALDAYYRHFNLSYTDQDVLEVCKSINPRQPERLRKQLEAGGLGFSLRESAQRLCAAKHLVEHADIKVKGEDDEEPAAEEEAAAE